MNHTIACHNGGPCNCARELADKEEGVRTCVGEMCAFMENLGMMSHEFAYTCVNEGSASLGVIFTDKHPICEESGLKQ